MLLAATTIESTYSLGFEFVCALGLLAGTLLEGVEVGSVAADPLSATNRLSRSVAPWERGRPARTKLGKKPATRRTSINRDRCSCHLSPGKGGFGALCNVVAVDGGCLQK